MLYGLFVFLLTYGRKLLLPKIRKHKLSTFLFVIIILTSFYIFLMNQFSSALYISILISIPYLLLLLFLIYIEFSKFYSIGINNIDATIKTGFDHSKALKECKNSMKFIGLAASKLTTNTEFENALSRCSHGEIKLLLLKPTDQLLVDAAKKANVSDTKYKSKSIESLRKIREINKNRAISIQVRFYDELPVFRLMFIDSYLCLMSYYVLGEGDGSQLPQLQLVNDPKKGRKVDYLYFAFEQHFNQIWKRSEEWDFEEYV